MSTHNVHLTMNEKVVGFILLCAIVPLAIISYIFMVVVGLFGDTARVRQGVRALDHFVNATLLDGYAWESISSHAWRERDKTWAKLVIKVTDKFQKDHCKKANKREQPIVDLMLKKKLYEQTVGKRV